MSNLSGSQWLSQCNSKGILQITMIPPVIATVLRLESSPTSLYQSQTKILVSNFLIGAYIWSKSNMYKKEHKFALVSEFFISFAETREGEGTYLISVVCLNCTWFFGSFTSAAGCFQLVAKFKLKVKLLRSKHPNIIIQFQEIESQGHWPIFKLIWKLIVTLDSIRNSCDVWEQMGELSGQFVIFFGQFVAL